MTEKENIILDAIRKKIKNTRKQQGLSIRSLAAKAGIEPTLLNEYESGQRDTRSLNLIKILLALNLDLSFFTDDSH